MLLRKINQDKREKVLLLLLFSEWGRIAILWNWKIIPSIELQNKIVSRGILYKKY